MAVLPSHPGDNNTSADQLVLFARNRADDCEVRGGEEELPAIWEEEPRRTGSSLSCPSLTQNCTCFRWGSRAPGFRRSGLRCASAGKEEGLP